MLIMTHKCIFIGLLDKKKLISASVDYFYSLKPYYSITNVMVGVKGHREFKGH